MNNRDEVIAVRNRLKHSWVPFFSRFGRLTPVQIKVIPAILDGANAVVFSPTASGKTEAVAAPIGELFVEQRWEGLAILYIVPTRALANDTLVRLEGPFQDMNLTCALKHGDRPGLPKVLPNILITTPESLDSLLCRRTQALSQVRSVVLDEIHLLDNTYRGDQLRILLERLRRVAPSPGFATHLLSATLAAPESMARRYVTDRLQIIQVPGQREIEYRIFDSLSDLNAEARRQGLRKVLFFCNRRAAVESLGSELGQIWRPYPVVTHHGSLSRSEREEAESIMKDADIAVCVATSTLEVGIDIGDIELIVLGEPPWSVASLLQRIGRGNRRTGISRAWALAASDDERRQLEAMFTMASAGELPPRAYEPDLSVLVQQIFSFLYQNVEGVPEIDIVTLLAPIATEDQVRQLLFHLRDIGWVELQRSCWLATTQLMDLGEEGRIHSNIPDSLSFTVVDADSGNEVGTVGGVVDDLFALAQRTWRVVSVEGNIIHARQQRGASSAPIFGSGASDSAFAEYLPPTMRHPKVNKPWGLPHS